MDSRKIIGERINTALAEKGVKQKELAKALGVSDNTISYFCSGARTPNTEQIIKIAQILCVSTDYLLGQADVTSTDTNIRAICEFTGLSMENVDFLRRHNNTDRGKEVIKVLNMFLKSGYFRALLDEARKYNDYYMNAGEDGFPLDYEEKHQDLLKVVDFMADLNLREKGSLEIIRAYELPKYYTANMQLYFQKTLEEIRKHAKFYVGMEFYPAYYEAQEKEAAQNAKHNETDE